MSAAATSAFARFETTVLLTAQEAEAAMKKAHYELIEDGTFWGNIPGFQGLWGNAPTLEECREDLRGALEVWLVLGLWLNDTELPVLGRLSLVPRKLAAINKMRPLTRREIVRRLRRLGFVGPTGNGPHQYMVKSRQRARVPNEHGSVVSVGLIRRMLREAGISVPEWESVA